MITYVLPREGLVFFCVVWLHAVFCGDQHPFLIFMHNSVFIWITVLKKKKKKKIITFSGSCVGVFHFSLYFGCALFFVFLILLELPLILNILSTEYLGKSNPQEWIHQHRKRHQMCSACHEKHLETTFLHKDWFSAIWVYENFSIIPIFYTKTLHSIYHLSVLHLNHFVLLLHVEIILGKIRYTSFNLWIIISGRLFLCFWPEKPGEESDRREEDDDCNHFRNCTEGQNNFSSVSLYTSAWKTDQALTLIRRQDSTGCYKMPKYFMPPFCMNQSWL